MSEVKELLEKAVGADARPAQRRACDPTRNSRDKLAAAQQDGAPFEEGKGWV